MCVVVTVTAERRSATRFRADADHPYWESEPIAENARTAGEPADD
ncbi:MAG: hypothetical protein ACOC06_00330 [Halorubrum sp.]